VDLSKLVVKAILLMESSGGQVIGLTSDGASTNRTMWNLLGVYINIIINNKYQKLKIIIISHLFIFDKLIRLMRSWIVLKTILKIHLIVAERYLYSLMHPIF